jgi:hypothetical protein
MLNAPRQGYAADLIAPRVVFTGRTFRNKDAVCLAIFVVSLLTSIVMMIQVATGANVSFDFDNGGVVFSDELEAAAAACSQGRGLQVDLSKPAGVWSLLSRYPQVPAVMLLLVPIIAVMWILVLIRASNAVVWVLVILDAVIYIICGVFLMITINSRITGSDPTTAYLLIAYGVVLLVILYVTRKHITKAGDHLTMATKALSADGNKHIFAAAAVTEALLLVVMAVSAIAIINAGMILEVDPVTCSKIPATWALRATYVITFNMFWVVAFFKMAQLQSTAMATAAWFFDQREEWSAFKGLKLALTSSAGTLAFSSVVAAITDTIVWEANKRFWWINPVDCFLKLLLACFRTLIMSLTRFCVIAHSLTGLSMTGSSSKAFGVLKRNFVGGFITSRMGTVSLKAAAFLFSLALGFASWAWLDASTGIPTLQLLNDAFLSNGNSSGVLYFAALVYFYLFLVRRPMMTIFGIILISQHLTSLVNRLETDGSVDLDAAISTPLASLFIASIANVMLTFQARVILGAMETIFFCHAVCKEGGVTTRSDLDYKLLEDEEIVIASPVGIDYVSPSTMQSRDLPRYNAQSVYDL